MSTPSIDALEFAAAAAPAAIVGALRDHGCALVRGLLPAAPLRTLFHRAAKNFAFIPKIVMQSSLALSTFASFSMTCCLDK